METTDVIYEILKWIPPENLYLYKGLSKRYYYIINELIRNKNKYFIYYIKDYITLTLYNSLSNINNKYSFNITSDILLVYNYINDHNKSNVNHPELQLIINKLYNKLIIKILDFSIYQNIKIFEMTFNSINLN